MILTASRMFGGSKTVGDERCFYCGTECDDKHTVKDKVSKTFTNHDEVKHPSSKYVCEGCAISTSSDYDLTLITGEERKSQWVRLYSWIITWEKNIAATKSHIQDIRNVILHPPEPPFAIVISDMGKKQLVFRAPVAFDREVFPVLLEEDVIQVDVSTIGLLAELADYTASMVGKTGLLEKPSFGYYAACEKYVDGIDIYEQWLEVQNTKPAKLAAWLAFGKGKGERQCQLKLVPKSSERKSQDTKVAAKKKQLEIELPFDTNA